MFRVIGDVQSLAHRGSASKHSKVLAQYARVALDYTVLEPLCRSHLTSSAEPSTLRSDRIAHQLLGGAVQAPMNAELITLHCSARADGTLFSHEVRRGALFGKHISKPDLNPSGFVLFSSLQRSLSLHTRYTALYTRSTRNFSKQSLHILFGIQSAYSSQS